MVYKSQARGLAGITLLRWAATVLSFWFAWPLLAEHGLGAEKAVIGLAAAAPDPLYRPDPVPNDLREEFTRKNFKIDEWSGNYLSPKVSAKTRRESLVAVSINGTYVKDLRGQTVFLRESIRAKLLAADKAMFEKKHQHIVINYGFRSNVLQHELFQKLNGKAKVAPPGASFHETGMALDLSNWRDAQRFMIEAGFVGGCYGIEEDLVHYSIDEISKASNVDAFRRCTLKEIPQNILKGATKVGSVGKAALGKLKKK